MFLMLSGKLRSPFVSQKSFERETPQQPQYPPAPAALGTLVIPVLPASPAAAEYTSPAETEDSPAPAAGQTLLLCQTN